MFCKKCGCAIRNGRCAKCNTAYVLQDRSRELDDILSSLQFSWDEDPRQPDGDSIGKEATEKQSNSRKSRRVGAACLLSVLVLFVLLSSFPKKNAGDTAVTTPSPTVLSETASPRDMNGVRFLSLLVRMMGKTFRQLDKDKVVVCLSSPTPSSK